MHIVHTSRAAGIIVARLVSVILLVIWACGSAHGQQPVPDGWELAPTGDASQQVDGLSRFALWTGCQPMGLLVEQLPDDAANTGLTRDALQAAAESRLRAARLYTSDTVRANSYLYVNVNVVGRAFAISLEFRKYVFDPATGGSGSATTWDTGTLGTHGGNASFVLGSVSRNLDRFLVEFLRVNESACATR